jgi:hypothetical protein
MSRENQAADYQAQQAAQCAAAATATAIAEIKDAYLNLEPGWLHLSPKSPDDQTIAGNRRVPGS